MKPGDRFAHSLIQAAVEPIQLPMGFAAAIDQSVLRKSVVPPAVDLATPSGKGQSLHRAPTGITILAPRQPVARLSTPVVTVQRHKNARPGS